MTIRFMSDTPYAGIEIEMQRIPGFRPRGSGIVVSSRACGFQRGSCSGCIKSRKNETGREERGCICQRERRMAASVPFSELLEQFAREVAVSPFVTRVSRVSARNPPVFFLAGHRSRFERIWEKHEWTADEDAMCAAVYLLTADRFLWGRSVAAILPGIIQFSEIRIHGVDLDGYVLFHTAKDLYKGTSHISLSELVDPELVSEDAFRLVLTAFLIRRYGPEVLSAERGMLC